MSARWIAVAWIASIACGCSTRSTRTLNDEVTIRADDEGDEAATAEPARPAQQPTETSARPRPPDS